MKFESDYTEIILTLFGKFTAMTYTLELENKEDFPKVKKFLEQIKGAKITDNEEVYEELPTDILESLHNYAKSVKVEDCISEEEFFAKSRRKICELYSQK